MQETLLTALQAIIVAAVPVLTGFIVKWINAKAAQVATAITNEKANECIRQVEAAVTTAVTATAQTYVDNIKKCGTFDSDTHPVLR